MMAFILLVCRLSPRIHTLFIVYVQAVAAAPVAVYFDVENDFQHYAGGIYSSVECSTQFNHAGVRVQ